MVTIDSIYLTFFQNLIQKQFSQTRQVFQIWLISSPSWKAAKKIWKRGGPFSEKLDWVNLYLSPPRWTQQISSLPSFLAGHSSDSSVQGPTLDMRHRCIVRHNGPQSLTRLVLPKPVRSGEKSSVPFFALPVMRKCCPVPIEKKPPKQTQTAATTVSTTRLTLFTSLQ